MPIRGRPVSEAGLEHLRSLLDDPAPAVRVVAAETLAKHGEEQDLAVSTALLKDHANPTRFSRFMGLQARNAIDDLGDRSAATPEWVRSLPRRGRYAERRVGEYIAELAKKIGMERRHGS